MKEQAGFLDNSTQILELVDQSSAEAFLRNNNFLFIWRALLSTQLTESYFSAFKQRMMQYLATKEINKEVKQDIQKLLSQKNLDLAINYLAQYGFDNLQSLQNQIGCLHLCSIMNIVFSFTEHLKSHIEQQLMGPVKKKKQEGLQFEFKPVKSNVWINPALKIISFGCYQERNEGGEKLGGSSVSLNRPGFQSEFYLPNHQNQGFVFKIQYSDKKEQLVYQIQNKATKEVLLENQSIDQLFDSFGANYIKKSDDQKETL